MSGTEGALRLIELTSAHLCGDLRGLLRSPDHDCPPAAGDPPAAAPIQPDRDIVTPAAAKALTARLELRRAAWGPQAGPDAEPMPLIRLKRLAGGLPGRVGVDLSALRPDTLFPADSGRIVLNLLLLAADSLPFGGIIMLAGSAGDLFIQIVGSSAAWPPGIALCLANETEARSALTDQRSLQMALTALLGHAARIRLSMVLSPTANDEPAILRLGG